MQASVMTNKQQNFSKDKLTQMKSLSIVSKIPIASFLWRIVSKTKNNTLKSLFPNNNQTKKLSIIISSLPLIKVVQVKSQTKNLQYKKTLICQNKKFNSLLMSNWNLNSKSCLNSWLDKTTELKTCEILKIFNSANNRQSEKDKKVNPRSAPRDKISWLLTYKIIYQDKIINIHTTFKEIFYFSVQKITEKPSEKHILQLFGTFYFIIQLRSW